VSNKAYAIMWVVTGVVVAVAIIATISRMAAPATFEWNEYAVIQTVPELIRNDKEVPLEGVRATLVKTNAGEKYRVLIMDASLTVGSEVRVHKVIIGLQEFMIALPNKK